MTRGIAELDVVLCRVYCVPVACTSVPLIQSWVKPLQQRLFLDPCTQSEGSSRKTRSLLRRFTRSMRAETAESRLERYVGLIKVVRQRDVQHNKAFITKY